MIFSGEEAAALLIWSKKVINILKIKLRVPQFWSVKIILKQPIDIGLEAKFRIFINKNNITTGISQLHHLCYFPELSKKRVSLDNCLTKFAKQIKSILHITGIAYWIDVAVLENTVHGAILLDIKPLKVLL